MQLLLVFIFNAMLSLYTFSTEDEISDWRIINDSVMGGLSNSRVSFDQEGIMKFYGYVSLENNGGFASCRTTPKLLDLDNFDRICIRVKGDGRDYNFRLRTDKGFDGASYVQGFSTKGNSWETICLPFSDFVPQFRGRILENYEKLDTHKIMQMGIMISDKKEGEFALDVDAIYAE